ncbi:MULTISPECIES: NUDIX hydrolase [Xanthomonas translucens group]|uniref:DNA mismatch repair protein MutT n=1 Tax=Xanthomonas graminis pv. poae TaxID=227946 RepID=A0A199P329_9XANT|nr:NUDIX hydrolase [Xanthomonas translucens]AVY65944.1 DNA mismatch repair protein MutT [Xanthomonas translucens pv. undulosa]ELP96189.1 NUDIX hydrolase [Xanthomonas translucens DAR61454]MBC3974061.1 NUDIX hydrolase [Xanthomonas translucens pv. undulosa]MCT8283663.1 NUDIX hydrolase [Xanthomonas translucens pv. undulosa]MCT8318411.1 NUDIX hydrolase [Xanthomonas translucens pv. undulosa]
MTRPDSPPRIVYEGKYQRMVVRGTWEYSERVHAGGLAAIIVAVTPDDEVLFVEQFRVPLQARTIEMPAGLVGDIDAGESIELSAVRELEEETGWTADHAEVLMIGPTSSGASNEKVAFVRASGLHKVGDGGGDASEDITVHAVPRARAAAWLVQKMGEGYELDAKLWAGLWMIEHQLDGTPRG